jgi:SAM-dependent methyltransferase
MTGKNSNNHQQFYNQSELYDIAFDFKDIKAECNFLTSLAPNVKSFLELGAGPALHCIEMAKRGIASTALDLSNSMVEYGLSKAQKNEVEIEYIRSNMIDFKSENKWDLVATLMDSISYIHTNDAFITHLKTVAKHLNKNGLYVLEMIHPRDVFGLDKSTNTNWEIERDGKVVKVNWGNPHDVFDPITQVVNTSVRLESGSIIIEDIAPQRKFTFNELDALIKAGGCFEMIAVYGAMDKNIPFNNDKAAWRMVPILRMVK